MRTVRSAARAAVRDALAADDRIGPYKHIKAWHKPISVTDLPAYAVMTAADTASQAAHDTLAREIDLIVDMRRAGSADVEEEIDLDVAAIEALIGPALLRLGTIIDAEPRGVDFAYSGEGSSIVVAATIRATCLYHQPLESEF